MEAAAQQYPKSQEIIAEGLEALEVHRRNYTDDGPNYLQLLLWWEFPPEQWESVRVGSSMRFLVDPGPTWRRILPWNLIS